MRAYYLVKTSARKRRRGALYYVNRRKKLGMNKKHMSMMDYIKFKKKMKKARRRYDMYRGVNA